MVNNTSRTTRSHHPKRYGHHQRQTKPFLKTYLPYLPLLAILITGITFALRMPPRPGHNVLAYAVNLNAPSLLEETNNQRAAVKAGPLKTNDKLSQAAQAKADDMAKRNYWSHTTPDGQQPWTFIDQAGYAYQKAGENLAYGFSNSKATVTGWMNSPSHKANMLDSGFDEVGFGYADASNYQQAGASTIVVALYARSQVAAATAGDSPVKADTQTIEGTVQPAFVNTRTYRIARIQIMTNGRAPWSLWALLSLAGIGLLMVLIKHSLALRRWLVKGEKFVLKHPLFDVTLASFIVLCVFISSVEGYILSATF